jgi:hypothetical protein
VYAIPTKPHGSRHGRSVALGLTCCALVIAGCGSSAATSSTATSSAYAQGVKYSDRMRSHGCRTTRSGLPLRRKPDEDRRLFRDRSTTLRRRVTPHLSRRWGRLACGPVPRLPTQPPSPAREIIEGSTPEGTRTILRWLETMGLGHSTTSYTARSARARRLATAEWGCAWGIGYCPGRLGRGSSGRRLRACTWRARPPAARPMSVSAAGVRSRAGTSCKLSVRSRRPVTRERGRCPA